MSSELCRTKILHRKTGKCWLQAWRNVLWLASVVFLSKSPNMLQKQTPWRYPPTVFSLEALKRKVVLRNKRAVVTCDQNNLMILICHHLVDLSRTGTLQKKKMWLHNVTLTQVRHQLQSWSKGNRFFLLPPVPGLLSHAVISNTLFPHIVSIVLLRVVSSILLCTTVYFSLFSRTWLHMWKHGAQSSHQNMRVYVHVYTVCDCVCWWLLGVDLNLKHKCFCWEQRPHPLLVVHTLCKQNTMKTQWRVKDWFIVFLFFNTLCCAPECQREMRLRARGNIWMS